MWLIKFVFLFGLVLLTESLNYDEIARDECLKKAYICGDYRVSITGGTGVYVAEPNKFREICRRHKEFISCIEEAAVFCENIGNITELAAMVLDNRISLKMFCKESEWRKNYFANIRCVNQYEDMHMEECRREEEERELEPWWCLVPEPCDAMKRVFDCSVEKMKQTCGDMGTEVYKRMYFLKIDTLDVVCEFRRRNPRYCAVRPKTNQTRQKRKQSVLDFKKRSGTLSPVSTVFSDLIKEALITVIEGFLKYIKSHDLISESKSNKLFIELNEIIENEEYYNWFTDTRKKSTTKHKSEKALKSDENKFLSEFKNVAHENTKTACLNCKEDSLNNLNDAVEFIAKSDLPSELNIIKESVVTLHELLKHKSTKIDSSELGYVEITWNDLDKFPILSINCDWSTEDLFKCAIEYENVPLSLSDETKLDSIYLRDTFPDIEIISEPDDQAYVLSDGISELHKLESDATSNKETIQTLIKVLDNDKLNVFEDIGRKGYFPIAVTEENLFILESEKESELNENLDVLEAKETDEVLKFIDPNSVLLGEPYSVDKDSVYEAIKDDPDFVGSDYFAQDENFPINSKQSVVLKETEFNIPENDFKGFEETIQLDKIENVLNERFQNIEIATGYADSVIENKDKSSTLNKPVKNYSSKICPEDKSDTESVPNLRSEHLREMYEYEIKNFPDSEPSVQEAIPNSDETIYSELEEIELNSQNENLKEEL